MPRLLLTALLLLASFAAPAADDLKVMQLEQDVRDLKRQVLGLTRQVEELQRRPTPGIRTERAFSPPATASAGEWVDAAKWNRLKSGMSELEVISTLGPPTTIREESGCPGAALCDGDRHVGISGRQRHAARPRGRRGAETCASIRSGGRRQVTSGWMARTCNSRSQNKRTGELSFAGPLF